MKEKSIEFNTIHEDFSRYKLEAGTMNNGLNKTNASAIIITGFI